MDGLLQQVQRTKIIILNLIYYDEVQITFQQS